MLGVYLKILKKYNKRLRPGKQHVIPRQAEAETNIVDSFIVTSRHLNNILMQPDIHKHRLWSSKLAK